MIISIMSVTSTPPLDVKVSFQTHYGPGAHAPFPAVVASFAGKLNGISTSSVLASHWITVSSTPLWDAQDPSSDRSMLDVICALATQLQHPHDPEFARILAQVDLDNGVSSIALGFIDPIVSALVLQTAIELTESLFSAVAGDTSKLKAAPAKLESVKRTVQALMPQGPIIRTLVHEAWRRQIPVYPVAAGSGIWLFGQGAAGFHFYEAANDRDSFTGMWLARDKTLTNRLVRQLGFPGTLHMIATSQEMAIQVARKLGYPVVVKPVSSGKGKGVSANIIDDAELDVAYAKAAQISPNGVIIERHIVGDDHRLAVFGGKLAWVALRSPARVTGDGISSVAELIAIENRRRQDSASATDDGLLQLDPDPDMHLQLSKQGLTMESRLPTGVVAKLRSVANLSKGGDIADVTERVHPDNIAMAEAIARGFRMDTLGIDFMTPDISRSWREVPCAIIEVNGTPGIFFDARARKILLAKFPTTVGGRVPSVLLVDASAGVAEQVAAHLTSRGRSVGQAGDGYTMLSGSPRCQPNAILPEQVKTLVFDSGCNALVIETTVDLLNRSGLPLDYFDLVISFGSLEPQLDTLLRSCSRKLGYIGQSDRDITSLLDDMLVHHASAAGAVL